MNENDLIRINQLFGELQTLRIALDAIDGGARITAFQLGVPPNMGIVTVASSYMSYPPQMTDMIKTLMTARRDEVVAALHELGMTLDGEPAPTTRQRKKQTK